jgi:hypothetical protein
MPAEALGCNFITVSGGNEKPGDPPTWSARFGVGVDNEITFGSEGAAVSTLSSGKPCSAYGLKEILTEHMCRHTAAQHKREYKGTNNWSNQPAGCYQHGSTNVYFNKNMHQLGKAGKLGSAASWCFSGK